MRLVRYVYRGNESYGALKDGRIIDLPSLYRLKGDQAPEGLEELIISGWNIDEADHLIDELSEGEMRRISVNEENATLKAPIISPPKIICLGLNYKDHAEEAGAKIPEDPIIFMKPRTSIVGPQEPVIKPDFVKELDYEVELAIIIGRKGKDIPVSEAADYIFGYTVFNDISARDIQFKDGQWTRGKSFDTFAPTGPCITTSTQIGNPTNLRLRTRVNEEIRQDSSTSNMVFNVYEVIHHLSRVMTLEQCDIIATGTPGGVAAF
ncbi:TPA: FAA hydrolase family protein, partial [Candidatus Bathyarchaeota archaeon]|nr:FAA hydrolase family protein [Candidatus Bathyarchaeota archaeon]